jgi:sugar-specific transcriptional regulator TrmB
VDQIHELTSYFIETGYFESIHEARVLAHIVSALQMETVKTISEETGIHNSRVYPALKNLEQKTLIQKNGTERPVAYFATNPEIIKMYLENALKIQLEKKTQLIDKIHQLILRAWKARPQVQQHFSHVFKDGAIHSEIRKLQKQTLHKITYIIGPKSYPYIPLILNSLEESLRRNIQVWIAIPFTTPFLESFADIYQRKNPLVKLKRSIWLNPRNHNGYVISDNSILLNITHRQLGDDAILTNDIQIISQIQEKWNDERCIIAIDTFPSPESQSTDLKTELNI